MISMILVRPHTFVAAVALVVTGLAPAESQQALVLSGGGARGLAHIGVLQVLEETGHDPRIVVGNSMGAVIGALFAAGYSADQIREQTVSVRWDRMFDPSASVLGPARQLRLPQFTFNLQVAERRASRGLFGEWRINRAIVHLLFDANTRSRGDFDLLPRRFRAVAADLTTGAEVVLSSGDLPRAVRASMAYPGFFAPVQWDERVLIDGGIVDNLPTAVARGMGAARIIAVDVSHPEAEIKSYAPLDVAQRSLDLIQRNLHPDPIPPDILIVPIVNVGLLGLAFPDSPIPLIAAGADAARKSLPSATVNVARQADPAPQPPISLAGVSIDAPDSALAALARRVFASAARGSYDADGILAAVDRMYASGLVDGVWPLVTEDSASNLGSVLRVRLDAPARLSLSVAGGYDNDRGGRAWGSLERYVAPARHPGVIALSASNNGVESWASLAARLQSISFPSFILSTGGHIIEHRARHFSEGGRATEKVRRSGGWVGTEVPHLVRELLVSVLGRAERVRLDDDRGGISYGPLVRASSVPSSSAVVGAPSLLEFEARWGRISYRRGILAVSWSRIDRLLQTAALLDVRAVSEGAPVDVTPALGDDHGVPGLRWGERRGRARVLAGIDLAARTPVGPFLRLRVRGGAAANEPRELRRAEWITGAQMAAVWRIPLGTFEAGYSRHTAGGGRFDVSAGRIF